MLSSRGLKLSCSGGLLVALSMLSLFVLPGAVGGVGMMIGAVAVIGGFIWTMTEYYVSPTDPPRDN
ncbi:MAG TPA: hypothetical protein VIB47_05145 [Dehalococcoidia bacterium]